MGAADVEMTGELTSPAVEEEEEIRLGDWNIGTTDEADCWTEGTTDEGDCCIVGATDEGAWVLIAGVTDPAYPLRMFIAKVHNSVQKVFMLYNKN